MSIVKKNKEGNAIIIKAKECDKEDINQLLVNKKEKIISKYDKISDSKKEEKKLISNKKENINKKKKKKGIKIIIYFDRKVLLKIYDLL